MSFNWVNLLALNRQVLVLVPEIGLTPQLLHRFKSRINQPLAVIHSQLNEQDTINRHYQKYWLLPSQSLIVMASALKHLLSVMRHFVCQ